MSEATHVSSRKDRREATCAKILFVAERMFGAWGYDGVSVRKIASEADVELSLLLYHFKSKDELYRAVFEKSARAILERRHEALAAVLTNKAPTCRDVLMALCESWLSLESDGLMHMSQVFERTMLRHADSQIAIIKEFVDPGSFLFIDALARAAPGAPPDEIHRCYHLFAGALVHVLVDRARIERLSGPDVADTRTTMALMADLISGRLGGPDEREVADREQPREDCDV